MKRNQGLLEDTPRKYAAAAITKDQKDMIARVYVVWKAQDRPQEDFVSIFEQAGFPLNDRSLRRWASKSRAGLTPISEEKGSGRPRSLDDVQWRMLVGCVIY